MGGALSGFLYKPITKKESTDESNDKFICGTSSMQGWRYSQEDAHNCILDYDTDTAFFAVYDGHGGAEVSEYCSLKLPQYIKESDDYKNGKIEEALTNCFLSFDKIFTTTDFVDELNKLRPPKKNDDDDDNDDNNDVDGGDNDDNSIVEENIDSLYKEASMPIEELIEKYATESLKIKKLNDNDQNSNDSNDTSACCSSSSIQASTSQQSPLNCSNDINSDGVSSSSESKNIAQEQSNIEKLDNETTKNHVPDSSDMKKDIIQSNTIENGNNEDKQQNSEAVAKTSDENESKNGELIKKEKGKNVVKQTIRKSPRQKATQIYKQFLENGSDEDEDDSDSESDEDEESFEATTVDSSEDECVNTAIEIDAEDSPEEAQDDNNDDDNEEEEEEDDDESDDEGGLRRYKAGYNSGCTAVVAILKGNELYVANIGDSRCIVCRNGEIIEMSFDHKPTDDPELERITKAGGEVFEERVEGGLNLSRAFGDHSYKRNKHLSDREQMITALPDIKKLTIKPNEDEFIFLACDGIWNSMTTEECVDYLRSRLKNKQEKLSEICEDMFDSCLATDAYHDSKGNDNMTAVLIKFKWNIPKRPSSPTSQTESDAKRVKTDDDCNNTPQIDTTV